MFIDERGSEYPAVVEFAPFAKIPKKRAKASDARINTIETGLYCMFVCVFVYIIACLLIVSVLTVHAQVHLDVIYRFNNFVL